MDRRISLHIGVWSPTRCGGLGTLRGPRGDPCLMERIAKAEGFDTRVVLPGDAAYCVAVQDAFDQAVKELVDGGTFLITFSGHGRQDVINPAVQTWCLANCEMKDTDLLEQLARFPESVRVLVVSASCHSGGLGVGSIVLLLRKRFRRLLSEIGLARPAALALPEINEIDSTSKIRASVLYLSSCSSDEVSKDRNLATLFTRILYRKWKHGKPNRPYTYETFIKEVAAAVSKVNNKQHPVLGYAGPFPTWYKEEHPFRTPVSPTPAAASAHAPTLE